MSEKLDITDPPVLLGTLYAILAQYSLEHDGQSLGKDAKEIETILRKAQKKENFWHKFEELLGKKSND